MMDSGNQIPTNLVESLTKLCADHKNTVYIITGNKMEGTIFSEIKNLGLACEYGYTFYDNMDEVSI
jgi:trehalose-6-phosphatase